MMKISQFIIYTILLHSSNGIRFSEPDRHCLDCICQASTGCKKNIQCHNTGNGQYYCGPYQISWAYWSDAGKPGDAGFSNDFEKCLVQKSCAEATVRGYMAKWGNDCNSDGQVDCLDYAAIHKAGATGCQQHWLLESKYWNEFQQCYRKKFSPSSPPSPSSLSSSTSSSSSSSSFSSSSSSMVISSSTSFRDTVSNQPSNTIIEIPRPLPPPSPLTSLLKPPLSLPPAIARASANVPGASASASASAGFEPNSGTPISLASTSVGNDKHEIEITEFSSRRLPGRRPNNILSPLPGPFNKPRLSSSLLVPSEDFKPAVPTRIVFPGSSSSSPPEDSNTRDSNIIPPNSIPKVEEPVELESDNGIVPSDCLQCLCQASSKCDLNKGCNGAYCGPYLLSWGYWADGGQPGNEYATCSKQKQCSELAIQGYMNKWKRDCNQDGKIDCIDFALIHKLGPHGCGQLQALEVTDYWKQFSECHSVPNKPVRSPRPVVIELPQPSLNSISRGPDSNERFIGPLPKPDRFPSDSEDDDLVSRNQPGIHIRVNNREVINTNRNSNRLREIPQPSRPLGPPRTRIDLSTLDPNRPVIIRIKPPTNNNNNNRHIPSPTPAPRPIPVPSPRSVRPPPPPSRSIESIPPPDEEEEEFIESPSSNIRNNEDNDFFSQPRPDEQPNESPNVFEVPRSPNNGEERNSPPVQPSARIQKPNSTRSTKNELVSQECLECICYASSKCSQSIGCRSDGSGKYICGPYQVDWEYWVEAGKPGNRADLSNLENFQMCLNNRECADRTVRDYISRWRKDCNEDGHIDCNDYAALHIAGPNQCGAQWYQDSKYYSDFRECFDF